MDLIHLALSGEAASLSSASQEFPNILWNPKVGIIPVDEVMDQRLEHSSPSVQCNFRHLFS
jgi:hypothetical protein